MDKQPINREILDEMRTVKVTASHTSQSLERMLATIRKETDSVEERQLRFTKGRIFFWGSVAAAILLAVGVSVATWENDYRSDNSSMSQVLTEYSTGHGDKATILLPDGSRVFLNVGSQLRLAPGFLSGERTVDLEGGGVFEVTHQKRSPFIVNTARTSSKVLGTRFFVEDYDEDEAAVIAVESGRVAVNGVVLPVHHEIIVKADSDIREIRPYFAGRFEIVNGVLNFPATRVAEAIPILERWYDIRIRVAEKALLDSTVAGQFTNNIESLGEILAMLLECEVRYENNTLTLKSRALN